jgi:hypothetical protein
MEALWHSIDRLSAAVDERFDQREALLDFRSCLTNSMTHGKSLCTAIIAMFIVMLNKRDANL